MTDVHTDEWHAQRATGIGGSEIAAILGLSPYESAWSLWARKTGLVTATTPDTPRLRIGRRMEGVIAAEFHDATGLYIAGEQMTIRHQTRHYARASVDGFVVESKHSLPDDALGVFEAKTASQFGWDEIPVHYLSQLRWNMAVAGLESGWLAVMFAGFRFDVFEVDQDPADAAFMLDRAGEFWALVESNTPPPIDGSDATARAIGARWPRHDPGLVHDADDELVELLVKRAEIRVRVLADERVVAECDNEIAARIGDAELIAVGGVPLWSYRSQSRESIDAKALRATHPEIAEQFTRTTSFRVLRALTPKEQS